MSIWHRKVNWENIAHFWTLLETWTIKFLFMERISVQNSSLPRPLSFSLYEKYVWGVSRARIDLTESLYTLFLIVQYVSSDISY